MRNVILLTLLLLLCFTDIKACDCDRGKISVRDFNSNDWIFIGTLLSQKTQPNHLGRVCNYKVIRCYKGVKQSDTIQVYDQEDIGACGLGNLTAGADYLIYARGVEKKWSSSCVGNSRAPLFILPRDSAAINNLRSNRDRGSIDDTVSTTFHTDTLFLSSHSIKATKNVTQKFNDGDGSISAQGKYRNGLPEGFWRYYEHGELVEYGRYRNGKKDSLWVRQSGTSKDIEEFRNGEYTYRQASFYNGIIYSKTEPVGDGKTWVHSMYHDNGKPRFIAYTDPPERNKAGRLKDPVWDGPYKTFNEAGIVLDEGLHKNGFMVGLWKYYYEDGKPRMKGEYVEGKKVGNWKIYHPKGKIKAIGAYENGEKIGEWKYYGSNGNQIPSNPELIKEDEDWFTYSGVKR